ncbi:gamma-glutamyl-gamma-aminobutyrate hydrolase family protein [Streptomyces sp. NPDC048288]|uniref:gamma-glutamyl-gamma-aminobutyrate hydrolase family protein n=1 Tax=Streptomyces sp. NPDC048288 TaxID=3365529 RepID=UPI00371EC79E
MTRTHPRPLIAIPARFAATASALRYAAEVNARALVEAGWRAGADVAGRLVRFDDVLLPGGGDLAPHRYGATDTHDSVYDVGDLQDVFDLEAARRALDSGLPLPAICRGHQVVNVALGGEKTEASRHHHRRVDRIGAGLHRTARAADGTVEELELRDTQDGLTAVQWHPEDTASEDPAQQGLFDALVQSALDRH